MVVNVVVRVVRAVVEIVGVEVVVDRSGVKERSRAVHYVEGESTRTKLSTSGVGDIEQRKQVAVLCRESLEAW